MQMSPSEQASDRRQGQVQVHKQLWGPLLSAHTPVAIEVCCAQAHELNPRVKLASYTHAAAETGLTTSVNLGLAGFRQWVKGRSQKGLRWLTSLNGKTCGAKATKNLQSVLSGYAGHWFLQSQKLLGSSAEQVTGNNSGSHCMVITGCPCSSLFLAICIYLSFASLWVG